MNNKLSLGHLAIPKILRGKRLALFVTLAMQLATSWSVDFMSSGYHVDFEETYGKGHSPNVFSVSASPDGGYAFAGTWSTNYGAWLVKTNRSGKEQWEQSFRTDKTISLQRAVLALSTKDGAYLMCGETNDPDLIGSEWKDFGSLARPAAAFVAKIDTNGRLEWRKIFGRLGKYWRNAIYRGVAVEDGFVFLGTTKSIVDGQDTSAAKHVISSFWLFKINNAGDLIWERTFPMDDGEYLLPSPVVEWYAKPLVDTFGNIVLAVATETILSEKLNGKLVLASPATIPGPRKEVLLIKLGRDGSELKRTRLAFGVGPSLIKAGDGYHLLDNDVGDHGGIRSVRLDADLNVVSEKAISAKHFWVQSAIPGPNGGLHLAGYHRTPPNERGQAAIAYLSQDGDLRHEKLFGHNSWPADLAGGASPAEMVFLWFGGWGETSARLTKLRLAD
ncbi:MAG: peptidase papain [Massilia sp.]|nr:peptidase papain [Massilia sp.]